MVLSEQLLVDARLIVETLQGSQRDQLQKILITLLVFGQKHQVIAAVLVAVAAAVIFALAVEATFGRQVDFAADDRFDAGLAGFSIEFQSAEHHTVIGHGHGRHIEAFGRFQQVLQTDGAVQQAVFGVDMEVNKRGHRVFTTFRSRRGSRSKLNRE